MSETGSGTVIEFGTEQRPSRFRGLSGDRRVAPLVAGLGGVAAFASLISEWQVTTVDGLAYDGDEVGETKMLPADLFDLSGVGAAYLVGLLLLTIAVVLALFGPAAGRRYARLAGLGAGGVLFALLLAMIQMLGSQSRLVSRAYLIAEDAEHLTVALGRGLWCALAAVAAALLTLWLSGRGSAEPPAERVVQEEVDEDEPLDLSITPTAPFAPTSDNRDIPL